MLPGVLEPRGQVVEGVPPRDVVDEEGAGRATVVGPCDGAESLLARLGGNNDTYPMKGQ